MEYDNVQYPNAFPGYLENQPPKPLPVLHQPKAALDFPTMFVSFYTKFTPNKKRGLGMHPNSATPEILMPAPTFHNAK
jgi:hypothetical protein